MSSYTNNFFIKKYHIFNLFLIITLLLPKAGITTNILPITIATLLYTICMMLNIFDYINSKISNSYILIYLYLMVSSIITILSNYKSLSAMNVTYMVVLLASPLTFLFCKYINLKNVNTTISLIIVAIGIYSILQFVIGVKETAIEGITIALGDDLSKKQIIRSGWVAKIPSTYTNGTLLAPSLIILLAYELEIKNKSKLQIFSIILGTLSLILSGSRSCIFAVILLIPYLLYRIIKMKLQKKKIHNFIFVFSMLPLLILLLIAIIPKIMPNFINQVYQSYIGFTKNDLTLSGRTIQWESFFQIIKELDLSGLIHFLFFGLSWNSGKHLEGLLLIMKLYGVIPFMIYFLFTLSVFLKFKHKPYIFYSLIVLFLVFMIDGSVLYPPTLMNVYLILGISYTSFEEKKYEKCNNYVC